MFFCKVSDKLLLETTALSEGSSWRRCFYKPIYMSFGRLQFLSSHSQRLQFLTAYVFLSVAQVGWKSLTSMAMPP